MHTPGWCVQHKEEKSAINIQLLYDKYNKTKGNNLFQQHNCYDFLYESPKYCISIACEISKFSSTEMNLMSQINIPISVQS